MRDWIIEIGENIRKELSNKGINIDNYIQDEYKKLGNTFEEILDKGISVGEITTDKPLYILSGDKLEKAGISWNEYHRLAEKFSLFNLKGIMVFKSEDTYSWNPHNSGFHNDSVCKDIYRVIVGEVIEVIDLPLPWENTTGRYWVEVVRCDEYGRLVVRRTREHATNLDVFQSDYEEVFLRKDIFNKVFPHGAYLREEDGTLYYDKNIYSVPEGTPRCYPSIMIRYEDIELIFTKYELDKEVEKKIKNNIDKIIFLGRGWSEYEEDFVYTYAIFEDGTQETIYKGETLYVSPEPLKQLLNEKEQTYLSVWSKDPFVLWYWDGSYAGIYHRQSDGEVIKVLGLKIDWYDPRQWDAEGVINYEKIFMDRLERLNLPRELLPVWLEILDYIRAHASSQEEDLPSWQVLDYDILVF